MRYTSLWGNSTSFSAYGVQEYGTFLNPSVSVTSISQDSFIVNTTQLSAASIHGYLNCSYNFSTAPEKTSCKYHEAKGITADFNIVWITVGDYLSVDGLTTHRASAQTELVPLGSYSALTFGATSTASKWHNALVEDWKDFGPSTVSYGKLTFSATTYYGAIVQFTQNAANVDPWLQQDNICGQYVGSSANLHMYSCSFPSSVASGDLLVVGFGGYNALGTITLSISSDSQSLSWLNEVATSSNPFGSTNVAVGFWSATATTTSSESVTVATSRSDSSDITMEIYDTTGVSPTGASAAGSGRNGVGFSTNSLRFDNGLLFGAAITDGQVGYFTAGSGYTLLQDPCSNCNDRGGAGEYAFANTMTSPTSFPMAGSVAIDWAEVGVNFPSTTGGWQYGASMSPPATVTSWDAVEMPTSGLINWNSLSGGQAIVIWTSSSNGNNGGFAQNGFYSNLSGSQVCFAHTPPNHIQVCVPTNSWALFYTYCMVCSGLNQIYYGDAITAPSGWSPGDHIFFSLAYYSTKGEYSFLFTDTSLTPRKLC